MRVSIAGTGYVGLVSGLCLAEIGHDVTCADIDEAKVARINAGQAPFFEPGLDELLARNLGGRFTARGDLRGAVLDSDLTMIAVGTPFDGRRIDLSFVKQAAGQIGEALAEKNGYHAVVVKSTVVPGTTDDVVAPIVAAASGKTWGRQFGVGSNPEFLSEGTAVDDFLQPDRIVLGGRDDRTRRMLAELYSPLPAEIPRLNVSNKAAEMIKYASNSLLATLISFSNEIGNLCTAVGGIDAGEVMKGVHASHYLTPRDRRGGRSTAPIAAFLMAGCGFGGSCLPKDVAALVRHGQDEGEAMPLLSAVLEINARQPERMLCLLSKHFPDGLEGICVAVLGLAFKPETDDVRESPALAIVRRLLAAGARVKAYDPIANGNFAAALDGSSGACCDSLDSRPRGPCCVEYCESLDEALAETDAALLVTSWNEFAEVPARLACRSPQPLLIDGRRMIDRSAVERYEGIGAA